MVRAGVLIYVVIYYGLIVVLSVISARLVYDDVVGAIELDKINGVQ